MRVQVSDPHPSTNNGGFVPHIDFAVSHDLGLCIGLCFQAKPVVVDLCLDHCMSLVSHGNVAMPACYILLSSIISIDVTDV